MIPPRTTNTVVVSFFFFRLVSAGLIDETFGREANFEAHG